MLKTEILEPITCDIEEMKTHSQNYIRVKTVLAAMKPGNELVTFDDFLDSVSLNYDNYIMAIRSSLTKPTVFIRRQPVEQRVNNFNIHCLNAWRANMDIQFILDIYACATYITSYVAKSARGMSELLRNACEEARHGNSNLKQQVRLIGNKFLNNVEVSAQEAVYLLLQLPLKRSSRQVVFINTSPPDERVYLLKSNIDKLPDDAEVSESNLISRYITRNYKLESVCLADYAALYDGLTISVDSDNPDEESQNVSETIEVNVNELKRRKVSRIIRTVRFNPAIDAEKLQERK